MAVVQDGASATQKVDWEQLDVDSAGGSTGATAGSGHSRQALNASLSATMCQRGASGCALTSGLFDRDYFPAGRGGALCAGNYQRSPGLSRHWLFLAPGVLGRKGQGSVPPHYSGVRPERVYRLYGMCSGVPGWGDSKHSVHY
ncbi:Uncharacterised protein [Mobiluncus holmesii]|nr:Uncharacterised protein [Mobiluncus holmesii]